MCAGWPNSCDWQMLDDDRQPSTSNSYTGMSLAANESMLQIFNCCSLLSLKSAQLYSYSQLLKHQTNYKLHKSYSNIKHIFVVVFCSQDRMIMEPSLYILPLLVRRDSKCNLSYNFLLSVTYAYNFLGTACTWAMYTLKRIKQFLSNVVYMYSMYANLVLYIALYCWGKDDPLVWYEGTGVEAEV